MSKLSQTYPWLAALHDLPREEFRQRLRANLLEKGSNMTSTLTTTNPVRPGFRTVNVYLVSPQAPELLDFLKQAFGAEEISRSFNPPGGMHAEARLGDCMLMIGQGL